MAISILLTGGTGTLGTLLTPLLRDSGAQVRVLSRRRPGSGFEPVPGVEYVTGDLATGDGVEAAVRGMQTVVHCAGSMKGDGEKARALVDAAVTAGSPHLVYISVVGADRVPVVSRIDRGAFGYFAAKRAGELVVSRSGLPWTTLRASQFHDLVLLAASQLVKLPVMPVPTGMRYQPVDAGEVAERMAELAVGTPSGLVPDLAGPRIYTMTELVRSYLRATERHRLLLPVHLPGGAARAIREGANLAPDRAVGVRSWEEFLAERTSPRPDRAHR